MGITFWEAQQFVHLFKKNGRLDMLDLLSHIMDVFPPEIHFLCKEHFRKTMLSDIKGQFKKMKERIESYYRKQAYKIKDRTLLISQDLFGKKIDENDITNIYPYKFEVCSQQKINEAIRNKDKSYYYYQPAYTQNKFAFVFDPATGEVVYANYERTNSTHLNKKDIEDLVDAIGKK